MTDQAEPRTCIRRNCSLRGLHTQVARCPECDFPTRELHEFRPDPDAQQLQVENLLGGAAPPRSSMLVVTMNDVPGYRIVDVLGDVWGVTVRARDYFTNLGASFRTISGGEVAGYTRLLTESRIEARERMLVQAAELGADAVVAMRFDCNEIGNVMNEIAAYGTAVRLERLPAPQGVVTPG